MDGAQARALTAEVERVAAALERVARALERLVADELGDEESGG